MSTGTTGPSGGTGPNTTGNTGGTGGTSTATTTINASSIVENIRAVIADLTETTLTTDVYGLFVGAFFVALSLIVLFSTGSVLSVLVLWAVIGLILTVMVYYGFLTGDELLGTVPKEKTETKPVAQPAGSVSGGPMVGSEVFHVSDQNFVYDEAAAVCAAYGAELATLEQIMDAFASGAEWCGYGWSAGGMALYPTQLETWKRLQAEVDNGKRTRCGRPGVNGGYFDPNLKFGVNCFGFKPDGAFTPPAPVPGVDSAAFNAMVNRFKLLIRNFTLNPYSRQEWSEYDDSKPKPPAVKESFIGGGFFNAFKQDFFTPYGVREHMENPTENQYFEPVGQGGLGQGASSLRGPFGLRGDIGEMGATGAKGDQGLQGTKGEPGSVGPTGAQGNAGVGDMGPTGPQGTQGPTGSSEGIFGPTGPAGSGGGIGPTGERGPTGSAGSNGTNGKDGLPGKDGSNGTNGTNATIPRNLEVDSIKIGDRWLIQEENNIALVFRDEQSRGNDSRYAMYNGGRNDV